MINALIYYPSIILVPTMNKTALYLLTPALLSACSMGGVNESTPMIAVGPKADRPGLFSGKDGKFTGTFTLANENSDDTARDPATAAEPTAAKTVDSARSSGSSDSSVTVNADEYAEFKAWKDAREQAEFEAWKQQRERDEFETWKRSRNSK